MGQSLIQRAFAGGELAPALAARADQAKYQTGLRRCRNFVVQRHGGVANRAGFRFIDGCKTDDEDVMLLRYVSDVAGESLLLEMGDGYLRFFQNGAALEVDPDDLDAWDAGTNYIIGDLVTHDDVVYYAIDAHTSFEPPDVGHWYAFTGAVYELPSPFGTDLPNWYQSGRIVTFTHLLHPPHELERLSLTRWILRPVVTVSVIPQPTGLVVTPGGGAGARTYAYVVTAVMADTYEEGPPSAQVITGALEAPTPDAPHVLTWDPVAGAVEYDVYQDPYANGTYAFLGVATGAATYNDVGQTPDFAVTPPLPRALFATPDNYPRTATDYQQRRWFGQTIAEPDGVWGSRTGFRSNFGITSPLQDDDALTFRLAGNNNNPVQHLLGLKGLVLFTGAGEWTVGEPGQPLTPSSLNADQQTYVGAAPDVRPVVVGNSAIYLQARGAIVRDLQFDQQVEGLAGRDLTLYAAHLFDGYQIVALDYAQTPHSIVWCVRSDGRLLGLTYIREQEVWGWHWHDTGAAGRFEDVCVVPELTEDAVYVIVRRTIGGVVKRYIERLEPRTILTFDTEAFFVDSGLTYSGAPAAVVSGLAHLEGQSVVALADGTPRGPFTVTAGAVTLPVAASVVHVGLPITAQLETLDLDVAGSSVRDKKKRVGSLSLLLDASSRVFSAGPTAARLTPYVLPRHEAPADTFTGLVELTLYSDYGDHGRVFLEHTAPLPLTVLGAIPNVEVGG